MAEPTNTPAAQQPKQRWEQPRIVTLPRLTDLTLQTGNGIPGGFNVTYSG